MSEHKDEHRNKPAQGPSHGAEKAPEGTVKEKGEHKEHGGTVGKPEHRDPASHKPGSK